MAPVGPDPTGPIALSLWIRHDMKAVMPDFELILVQGHCAACAAEVSAPIDELRSTGVFACACGGLTRAIVPRVEGRPLFRIWAADPA